MDFKEVRFPIEISAWLVGGPLWNTRSSTAQNGDRTAIALWQYPLHKWQVTNATREIGDAILIKRFQVRVRGGAFAFRVWDPHDYSAMFGEGFLIATDSDHVFQLVKRYGGDDGDDPIDRKIVKPIPGTITVYGAAHTAIATAVVDHKTGLVTIPTADDPSLLTWIGLFDVPCYFGEDWLQQGMNTDGVLDITGMSLMEVRRVDASTGTPPTLVLPFNDPRMMPLPPPPSPATSVVVSDYPPSGAVGVTSAPFHFALDGLAPSPVHVTLGDSGDGGTWDPSSVTLSSAADDVTATYTPASSGVKTLTRTNDGGLANGASISFVVSAPAPAPGTPVGLTSGVAQNFTAVAGDELIFYIDTTSETNLHLVMAGVGGSGSSAYATTTWKHGAVPVVSPPFTFPDGTLTGSGTSDITPSSGREYFKVTAATTVSAGSITVTKS